MALSVKGAVTGKPDPVWRYGREVFRSGTVLSGSYGIENPGNGMSCRLSKGGSRDRMKKSQGDARSLRKNQFDFDDYLESIKQMKNMGGLEIL